MSVEIWPPIASDRLKVATETWQVSHLNSFSLSSLLYQQGPNMAAKISSSWVLIDLLFARPKQKNELDWLVEELRETLTNLRHGLEECYALLAPVDPGSTLVLSTPRHEIVKGYVTRVGTRIVKGVSRQTYFLHVEPD